MNYTQLSPEKMINAFQDGFGQSASGLWVRDACIVAEGVTDEILRVFALGQSGGLRKHVPGNRIARMDLTGYKLDVTKDVYSDGYPIPLPALKANPAIWAEKAKEMGQSVRFDVQRLVCDHLAAGKKAIDNATFFGAHTIGQAGSQTNLLTSSQVSALNISTPASPTVDEAVAALEGVFTYMQGYKGEYNRVVTAGQRSFVVLATTAAQSAAFNAAITVDKLSGGAVNTLYAAIKAERFDVKLFYEPALAGTNEFYVLGATPGMKGIVIGIDGPRDTSVLDPEDSLSRLHQAVEFQVTADLAVTHGQFYHDVKATFS